MLIKNQPRCGKFRVFVRNGPVVACGILKTFRNTISPLRCDIPEYRSPTGVTGAPDPRHVALEDTQGRNSVMSVEV